MDVSANSIQQLAAANEIDNFIGSLFAETDSKIDEPTFPSINTDISYTYVPSILPYTPRPRIRMAEPRRPASHWPTHTFPIPWEERKKTPPKSPFIRLLDDPSDNPYGLQTLWHTDYTLTEWHTMIGRKMKDLSDNVLIDAFDVTGQIAYMKNVFATNQRKRWLARVVQLKWTQRVWRKRTQCNVDMIDMAPIADKDAVFMTDTKHRQIFRFHRRDIFTNLLSNICLSDEMLPTPREPTNPWNNSKLTMPQTMGICTHLVQDFAKRGKCPPVLLAAFWAARFDLKRFQEENSALLSQQAITSYFKDLHTDNIGLVEDTIINLLTAANLDYSPSAIRRWLHQRQQTPLHRDWLTMARDYTLYINLHVQARAHWYTVERIYVDVARLYNRMTLPDPVSNRVRTLRTAVTSTISNQNPAFLGLSVLFPNSLLDISGSTMSQDAAIQLIQNALFRY